MSHSSGKSHKATIEHFAEVVNDRHVHHLENLLEADVQKTVNSKVVFANVQEAREYYSMEHEAVPTGKWKILECLDTDQHGNTMRAKVLFDNKIFNTSYTFGSSGKIHRIDSIYEGEHGSSGGHH